MEDSKLETCFQKVKTFLDPISTFTGSFFSTLQFLPEKKGLSSNLAWDTLSTLSALFPKIQIFRPMALNAVTNVTNSKYTSKSLTFLLSTRSIDAPVISTWLSNWHGLTRISNIWGTLKKLIHHLYRIPIKLVILYFDLANQCRLFNLCCCLVTKSCPSLLRPYELQPARFLCPWDFPGKNTRVGCHFLLQGIFQTQVLDPPLPPPSCVESRFFTAEPWGNIPKSNFSHVLIQALGYMEKKPTQLSQIVSRIQKLIFGTHSSKFMESISLQARGFRGLKIS